MEGRQDPSLKAGASDEALQGFGYGTDEIKRLREEGAV